jgi:hypothetical protein
MLSAMLCSHDSFVETVLCKPWDRYAAGSSRERVPALACCAFLFDTVLASTGQNQFAERFHELNFPTFAIVQNVFAKSTRACLSELP